MIQTKELRLSYVLYCTGAEIYLPALAGDLPHGSDMEKAAQAYVQDMREAGGADHVAAHVSVWTEFAAALAVAAAENKPRS
jgi:hypothetical protein